MFLKNLLVYLQILTLTASLTSENTGTKSNQREGSKLKSVNEQYGPGDSRIVEDNVFPGIGRTFAQDAVAPGSESPNPSPKRPFDPKTPSAKISRVGPPWIKNIAKHFKDKFLREDYKRTERAIYPGRRPDPEVSYPSGPSEPDGNAENVSDPKIPRKVDEDPVDVQIGEKRVSMRKKKPSKSRVLCYVNDSSRSRSLVVPCHFLSNLFYYLLVPRESDVVVFEVIDCRQPKARFDLGPLLAPVGKIPLAKEASNKSEEKLQVPPKERQLPSGDEEVSEPTSEASKVEDDISAPKKESDMPSFDEWKMQQEEGKNKDHKEQNSFGIPAQAKAKIPKKEINYASVTCGAKVIQANPEAQNPSYMLYENKDQYMINPCSAKKGFTVELCESIQVQAVELGNMEFFSSLPQSFDVHVGERFPVKEWIHVGTFRAKNERTVQSFPVETSRAYVKYIRIDVLSHYGNEHFCPLSILRVFGVSLDEDDEVEISQDETDYSDVVDVAPLGSGDLKASNLFSKATDTVISIMKTVLPSSGTRSEETVGDASDPSSEVEIGNSVHEGSPNIEVKKENLYRCLVDSESVPRRRTRRNLYEVTPRPDPICSYFALLVDRSSSSFCPKLRLKNSAERNVSIVGDETYRPFDEDSVGNESRDSGVESSEVPSADETASDESSEEDVDGVRETEGSTDRGGSVAENDGGVVSEERSGSLDDSKKLGNDAGNASDASKKEETNGRFAEGVEAQQKKEGFGDGNNVARLEPLKDYELDASNLDDVTYQKLSSKGKESVFAKLKNRIKNLEINLNLTNRYLEELSQRYKKQTEEMYTSLNKTISKLINTAKSAEERDLRQHDRIQSLEIRFSNLTTVFSSLHRALQDVHSQVLERHLLMMAVELALFFALLTYCQGQRRQVVDLQSRRSSAPAVPGKVVTSDPATSKSRGDSGTLVDARDEETEPLPPDHSSVPRLSRESTKELRPTVPDDPDSTRVPRVEEGVIGKGGSTCLLCGPTIAGVEDGCHNFRKRSEKSKTSADFVDDGLIPMTDEKSFLRDEKAVDANIISYPTSGIPCDSRTTKTRDLHCDILFRVCDFRFPSHVEASFSDLRSEVVEFGERKSKSVAARREVLATEFPMRRKSRAKKRMLCFPSDKACRWTRNVSNYFGSRPGGELVCRYLPRDSAAVRVGLKSRNVN